MNELKVGLLTLLAIASLIVVSLKITSNQAGFGEYVTYRAILNDATGIYEKSTIKVAGIVAGRIKSIELAGSQAVVTFEVLKSIKITKFATLRIKTIGFLGDKYLDIFLGDPNAPRMEEGQYVKVESGAGFEQLGKNAADVLADVKEISQAIKEALYDKDRNNIVRGIMEDTKAFAQNARDVSKSLKNLITGNEGKLNDTIQNLQKVAEQLAYETDRYADGSLMNDMEGVKPILANVRQATEDLKNIMADVKSGKGTVGKLLRDEEVVDQVNETLAGVNRLVNRINNFKTDLSIYTGYNNEFGGRTDLNMDIIPSPERFFKLGIVLSDYGPQNEEETTTFTSTNGGAETEVNEREIDESKFKFNLQIGRKIGNWGLRAGLIETTGGVGFDYHLPEYGNTNFLEVFDYQEDAGPNIRVGTEFRVWNVFHTKLMAEDLASKTGDQSFVISAGLKFTDDDLAALIGVLAN